VTARAIKIGFPILDSVTQADAAARVGTTPQAISQARLVEDWAPSEAKKVANGTMDLEKAYRIARKAKKIANLSRANPNLSNLTDVRFRTQPEVAEQIGTTPQAISKARIIEESAPSDDAVGGFRSVFEDT
jgi:hypothetical protein